MDKQEDIFTQFLGSNPSEDPEGPSEGPQTGLAGEPAADSPSDNDWVDSLYESINASEKPSLSHASHQQHQDELYAEVSKLKSSKLEMSDDQSTGSFTIPVDSPSMHMFAHSDEELDNQTDPVPILGSIPSSSNTSLNVKPPTFAQVQNIPIHPKPTPTQDVSRQHTTTSPNSHQLHVYEVIKAGLKEYCGSLLDAEPEKSLDNRAEYMSKYLQVHNVNYTPRNVSECFSQIRKDETDFNLSAKMADSTILGEIRALLVESVKRRKSYTRRKSAKPLSKASSLNGKPALSSIGSSTITNIPKQASSSSTGGVVNTIKIGAFLNQRNLTVDELNIQNLTAIADHSKVTQNREDERYIYQLRAQSPALKNCIDDIYGNSLPRIAYPLTYTKVPLSVSPSMSIDLENDRMISYVDVLLDMSDMIIPLDRSAAHAHHNNGQPPNYSKIIQLKSITRIYDHGTLIYRKCDPVTGFFPSDTSNVSKIILPLQAKFWAGFINDHHNGIVTQTVFENLKITHTLLPNDDIIKFRTGAAPIYSFVWEFDIPKGDQHMAPYSVIVSRLDNKRHVQPGFAPPPSIVPLPQAKTRIQFQQQHGGPGGPKRVVSMSNNVGNGTPVTTAYTPHEQGGFYKQPNHSMGLLPVQRHGLGIRNVSSSGHKRTRSRSVNEIDFLSDMNTIANSTFNAAGDPFTPVSPTMIMNTSGQNVLDPSFLQSGFDSFNSTPQSSLVSVTQTSFDFPQVERFPTEG